LRNEFVKVLTDLIQLNDRVFLMLGDIGVHGFRSVLSQHPRRAVNFGILEQSMIGVAAGLASEGMIPVIHTIAPFMIERAYEQIKIDLGYQRLSSNLVSVGGSYDYSALGPTHHCPADVNLLLNIQGMNIYLPGNSGEFSQMFVGNYRSGLNYYRLSEESHSIGVFKKGVSYVREAPGSKYAVLFTGPSLRFFRPQASVYMGAWIIYANHISLEERVLLPDRVKVCYVIQDFYRGAFDSLLIQANPDVNFKILSPPIAPLAQYGDRVSAYQSVGLSVDQVEEFCNE